MSTVADARNAGSCPDLTDTKSIELKDAFQLMMNHFEFIAAGLRNGDFDERLVRDSQRGTILNLFEWSQEFIWKLRTSRRRQTVYEHLEWLHDREKSPPKWHQRACGDVVGGHWRGDGLIRGASSATLCLSANLAIPHFKFGQSGVKTGQQLRYWPNSATR